MLREGDPAADLGDRYSKKYTRIKANPLYHRRSTGIVTIVNVCILLYLMTHRTFRGICNYTNILSNVE